MTAPIRILLAEDYAVVRQGIAALIALRPDMVVVGEAESGRQAVQLHRQLAPDVLLLDLGLPDMDGVEVVRRIRLDAPAARTLVLTVYDNEEDIYQAIHAGAQGYLLKKADAEELYAAILLVSAGKRWLKQDLAERLAERVGVHEALLTGREKEVLALLGKGIGNEGIAALLGLSENTVKTHLASLYAKLGAHTRTVALREALRRRLIHL